MPAPSIENLVTFPDSIILFPSSGGFQSRLFTSGAAFRTLNGGTVVMRFTAVQNWGFVATGTAEQSISGAFGDDQPGRLTMSWTLRTTISDATRTEIRVSVSIQGESTLQSQTKVMTVAYASRTQMLMRNVRRMLGLQ